MIAVALRGIEFYLQAEYLNFDAPSQYRTVAALVFPFPGNDMVHTVADAVPSAEVQCQRNIPLGANGGTVHRVDP